MINLRNQKLRLFLICLLMVSVIFLCLYHPFIFGGQMYAYEDIGSDTIHQYLPYYTVETTQIQNGEANGYNLQIGLGKYTSGLLTKYLNPSNLPILLFGADHLHIGLLAATYIKYVLICLFSLFYFLRLFKNDKAAVISALLWTFSGFNVLWGQHYHFLSTMVGFTACMYGFQLYLEEDRKWYAVVALMAFLVGSSYYFTYICTWFMVIYGILFLAFQKKSCLYIIKRVGLFALLALLTACICADYLVHAVVGFFDSSRTGQVENAFLSNGLFYPEATLISFCARFLSTDLIGTANEFKGSANYYEAAVLSVSLLFVFSAAYLLQGKYRWQTLGILLVCVFLLCTPLTSQLLVFTADTQRWTFLLCYLQTIAIGLALSGYLTGQHEPREKRHAAIAVLAGDAFLAVLGIALICYHYKIGGGWLNRSVCATAVAVLLMYHLAFLLLWKRKGVVTILLGIVMAELVLGNYPTVNHRDTLTVEQWYTQMYNDGTQNAVQWIKAQDDSIYRINKTYYSVYKTDSLVQGYNGMGAYSSTNSAQLVNLARTWGDPNAGSWVGFDGSNWLANDMLGVKYIISKSGEGTTAPGMELIYDDGAFCVYENTDWSGFGYLCYEEMAKSSLDGLGWNEQAMLLTHYYYRTGSDGALAVEAGCREVDLLPYMTEAYDCKIAETETGITISETGADAQLQFVIPELNNWKASRIHVEIEAQNPSVAQIFAATQSYGYSAEHSSATGYDAGRVSFVLDCPVDEPISLRFDPTMAPEQTLELSSLKLILFDAEQLSLQQTKQRETFVSDLTQEGNIFTGTLTNASDADAMLCLPLVYNEFWKAKVDGETVEAENINGGLTGMMIPSGTHTVELCYDDTVYMVGKAVSLCAIALYVAMVICVIRYQKRQDIRRPPQSE